MSELEQSPSQLNTTNNNINNNIGRDGWKAPNDMSDTDRDALVRICIDGVIMLCVGLPILAFHLWGTAYKRGFFCDDESLMHPFLDSTIPNWLLIIIGLILPVIMMLFTEVIQSKISKRKAKTTLFGYRIPTWLENSYRKIGIFAFGSAVSQLTTDIAKYSIGRLRPHFFAVCQPIMPDGSSCADPVNHNRYIEDFTCLGVGSTARMLKEIRLSFPSGHSSYSAFTMIYCIIYLQYRMTWSGSKLLKHFLQFCFLMVTWYTALSRISNYKHHWSDVLAGGLMGAICALLVANYISDLRQKPYQQINNVDTNYGTQSV